MAKIFEVEWEAKHNPVLKNEIMIVRKDTQDIIASLNIANFENDHEAYECAALMALAPKLLKKIQDIVA